MIITSLLFNYYQAFVDKFSHDLAGTYVLVYLLTAVFCLYKRIPLSSLAECYRDGVIIQSVMPTLLATKMYGFQDMPSLCVPSPDEFVKANLLTLGIESRTAVYWVHKILVSTYCSMTKLQ